MSGARGVIAYTGPPPISSLPPLPFRQDGRQVADAANWTYPTNATRGGSGPSPEDITLHILRYVSEVYLSMPIAILGIVGNIISLIVLCYYRRLHKLQTILVQLQALAVVDTLILISILLLRCMRYVVPEHFYVQHLTMLYLWLSPTAYFLRLFGIWLTVLLTVDRYIAVWYPLDAKRLCTARRTYLLMAMIAVLSMAFTIPRYFEHTLVQLTAEQYRYEQTWLMKDRTYGIVYRIVLFTGFQYVIPTAVLVYLNTRVIVALRRSDLYRSLTLSAVGRRPGQTVLTSDAGSATTAVSTQPPPPPPVAVTLQSTRSITVVVSAIVTLCIVVHLVALTAHLVYSLQMMHPDLRVKLDRLGRYLAQASNVLVTINSAVNFIVYCVFSRNFRSVLKRRLRSLCTGNCCRCGRVSVNDGPQPGLESYRLQNVGDGGTVGQGQTYLVNQDVIEPPSPYVICCGSCTCGAKYSGRHRHRRSTNGDTANNSGGSSKRSTTLVQSDYRSNGNTTATIRLTPPPWSGKLVFESHNGNGNTTTTTTTNTYTFPGNGGGGCVEVDFTRAGANSEN